MNRFMNFRGANAVRLSLINLAYVGGFLFDQAHFGGIFHMYILYIHPISKFSDKERQLYCIIK